MLFYRFFSLILKIQKLLRQFFSILTINKPSLGSCEILEKKLGLIGSAVLTCISYKETNRQRRSIHIDVGSVLWIFYMTSKLLIFFWLRNKTSFFVIQLRRVTKLKRKRMTTIPLFSSYPCIVVYDCKNIFKQNIDFKINYMFRGTLHLQLTWTCWLLGGTGSR